MIAGIVLPCDLEPTWSRIQECLYQLQDVTCCDQMVNLMLSIHNLANISVEAADAITPLRRHHAGILDEFRCLVERRFSPTQRQRFFSRTLPCMAGYALSLGALRPAAGSRNPFGVLTQGSDSSRISLDRRFVASLIANAFFFSTFPVRAPYLVPRLCDISFQILFGDLGSNFSQGERLKNLLNYFDTLDVEQPSGRVVYQRSLCGSTNSADLEAKEELHARFVEQPQAQRRRPLSSVFVVQEPRTVGINAHASKVILQEFNDTLLIDHGRHDFKYIHHPEVLIGLLFIEATLPDEWICIGDLLTARKTCPISDMEETQICLVERDSPPNEAAAMISQLSRCLRSLADVHNLPSSMLGHTDDSLSGPYSDKTSKLIRLALQFSPESSLTGSSELSATKPISGTVKQRRKTFSQRLKEALERGNTPPPSESSQDAAPAVARCSEASSHSFSAADSADSRYSFDPDVRPANERADDAFRQWMELEEESMRSRMLPELMKRMRRRALSDSFVPVTIQLDRIAITEGFTYTSLFGPTLRRTGSFCLNGGRLDGSETSASATRTFACTTSPPPRTTLWVLCPTASIDSGRFLIHWLAASLMDTPLVVYQTKYDPNLDEEEDEGLNGANTDMVTAICSEIHERGWDAKQLLVSLMEQQSPAVI